MIAIASLTLLLWVTVLLFHAPAYNLRWSPQTGIVDWIDPHSSVAGRVHIGDRVLAINGKPLVAADLLPDLGDQTRLIAANERPGRAVGDQLTLDVLRNGNHATITISLERQPPLTIGRRLVPLMIALLFWTLGLALMLFGSYRRNQLAFLFTQAAVVVLASETATWLGMPWFASLLHVMLWWLGPIALVFHLDLVGHADQPWLRYLAWLVNLCAVVGSALELLTVSSPLEVSWSWLADARSLWGLATLASVLVVLVRGYWHTPEPGVRSRIKLLIGGNLLAVLPFVLLYLLPTAAGTPLLSYEDGVLALSSIPLTYGYVMFRHRVLPFERYVNRPAVMALLWLVLGGSYALLIAVGLRWLPAGWRESPLAIIMLIVVVALTIGPSYHWLERWIDRQLYGTRLDFQTLAQHLGQMLRQGSERTTLVQSLCDSVQRVMRVEWAAMLLADPDGTLTLAAGENLPDTRRLHLEADSQLLTYFQTHLYPTNRTALLSHLGGIELSRADHDLLSHLSVDLWIPLSVADRLQGLLLIGPKRGGELMDRDDYALLQLVVQQASVVLQNLELVDALRQHTIDNESISHQILLAREDERTRLARELHDQVIQDLIGLNYTIAQISSTSPLLAVERLGQLQEQIQQTIVSMRTLCRDLRPPALDQLGLVGVLRERLRTFQETTMIQTRLIVEGDETLELPSAIALCLFRVAQESIANVSKHAGAQRVVLGLTMTPQAVWLTITDDGCGFQVPAQLEQLLDEQHFGLIGLRERLESVHGVLEIVSALGQGTHVRAWIPLQQQHVI